MFKKTSSSNQYDMFSQVDHQLPDATYSEYVDSNAWHNQFRRHVFDLIDESPFKILFSEKMGAPNVSVRRIVSMMILKEAFGWSDLQLFERCRFDLRVRRAIGLDNLNDPVPGNSTYYLLRKRMHEHQLETDQDLMNEVFQSITYQQIQEFEVEGQHVRMDSKLIGSNIAFNSRYEIIHQSLALFYKKMSKSDQRALTMDQLERLKKIASEKGEKVVYRNNNHSIQERMQEMGVLIWQLVEIFKDSDNKYLPILQRIFREQYQITDQDKIQVRPKQEISADSVQSPHDPDCSYRNKNGQQVKGYSYNVTETNDPDSLNLITDVQVDKAAAADSDFFQPAIDQTASVTGNKPENAYSDGAYNSQSNNQYCKENNINLYLTGMQGRQGKYDLIFSGDNLIVIDKETKEEYEATLLENNKWRIKTVQGYRYFTHQQVKNYQRRQEIAQLPPEITNRRNNVEATMFQLSVHLRNNKSKYRDLIKQKMWSLARSLWINLVRIIKHMGKLCQRTSKSINISQIMAENKQIINIFYEISLFLLIFIPNFKITNLYRALFRQNLNNSAIY